MLACDEGPAPAWEPPDPTDDCSGTALACDGRTPAEDGSLLTYDEAASDIADARPGCKVARDEAAILVCEPIDAMDDCPGAALAYAEGTAAADDRMAFADVAGHAPDGCSCALAFGSVDSLAIAVEMLGVILGRSAGLPADDISLDAPEALGAFGAIDLI